MELLRLRYFVQLAKTESLTQTASDLHISPSSLSLTIAKLESELGTKLFDRVGRKLQLNKTGEEFYFHVKNALAELDLAISKATQLDTVLVLTDSPTAWVVPLSEFAKTHPDLHVSNRVINRNSLGRWISVEDYDFWLTTTEPTDFADILNVHSLTAPTLRLAVQESSELAKKESVCFADLKDENFLFPFSTYPLYHIHTNLCREMNFEPNITANCGFYVRMKMVAAGLGVTFVDNETQSSDLFKRVTFLPISDAPALPVRYICWPKAKTLSSAEKEFLKFIRYYYQDV